MSGWTWAAAACRGTSHDKTGTRLQDAFACCSPAPGQPIVAMISDGAGTAELGGQGASLVCRSLTVSARRYFLQTSELPSDGEIETWYDGTRDLISTVASRRGREFRDFAATSVCVLSTGTETIVAHVGDGCAVLREESSGVWIVPSWPQQGEFASTTFFVTDQDRLQLRITRYPTAINAIAVFSDGIERLALDFAARAPSQQFFNNICSPIVASEAHGRDGYLSRKLREYLGSDKVNARTDDDKSLVIAALK
jgi:hypothetical protein